jgi:hypothetical protein
MVEFVDMKNDMLSTNIPKPGSYIKVYIGGYGDDEYYKPIRQDFVITNISKTNKTGGEYQNYRNSSNPIKYKFTGILNVPLGFRKMSMSLSSSKINARQALFNISKKVGLGFATNFDVDNNIDKMNWMNTQNRSLFDFMKDITNHSCYSPFTFFTSFIDQYYVFNYVECHRLLSHGGKKEDLPQMIYNCILPDMDEKKKKDDNSNSGEEQQDNNSINENEKQLIDYYFLTNDDTYKGWTNYIEEYYEINEGYSSMSDGYSKIVEYTSRNGYLDLNYKKFKFKIIPIDNLYRDNDRNIDITKIPSIENLSLSEKSKKIENIYIPLNLRQTTDPTYIGENNGYSNPSLIESYVDLGEHRNLGRGRGDIFFTYPYAPVQNDFQMKNLKKCGLSVRLQNYNPAITKFSRIWVDIYDMNQNSSTQIRRNEDIEELVKDNPEGDKLKKALKDKNDDIIEVKGEKDNDNEYRVYNRSLSGWYVVTDMKISYNTVKDFKGTTYKKLQTQLILNRIEYKPTFYKEYENARKAIEKYSIDNISSNLYELQY